MKQDFTPKEGLPLRARAAYWWCFRRPKALTPHYYLNTDLP